MGITFLGHTESFNQWVFDINGKRLIAENRSKQSPLQLAFIGAYDTQPLNLIKTSGFDILSSTATTAEWVWQGNRYKSYWEAEVMDPDDIESTIRLNFGPPVPYEGPAGGAVGTGVVSKTVIQANQENTGPSGSGYTAQVQPSGGTTTQTPSGGYGGPSGGGSTGTRRVVVAPNVPYAGPSGTLTAKTETDWAKLALQIGAAYLLFS